MSNLEIERSLGLVTRLRETLARFAALEQQLVRGLQSRRGGIQHQFSGLEDGDALAARLGATEGEYGAEEERVRAIFETRRARVERLRAQAIRQLPRRSREARENWLGHLQMRLRQAEMRRGENANAVAAVFAERTARLIEEYSQLTALNKEARSMLSAYPSFVKSLRDVGADPGATNPCGNAEEFFANLESDLRAAREQIEIFRRFSLPRVLRFAPIWAVAAFCLAVDAAAVARFGPHSGPGAAAVVLTALLLAGRFILQGVGKSQSQTAAGALSEALRNANRTYEACRNTLAAEQEHDLQRVEEELAATHAEITGEWERAGEVEKQFFEKRSGEIDAQTTRLFARISSVSRSRLEAIAHQGAARVAQIQSDTHAQQSHLTSVRETALAELDAEERTKWEALITAWKQAIEPIFQEIETLRADADACFPPWDAAFVEGWTPPAAFPAHAQFGRLEVKIADFTEARPRNPRLALPGPAEFSLPLALSFPREGSLLLEANEAAGAAATGPLNNLALRLLTALPPGKVALTLIDPVGLGQNFAGLMHLADYEESLIHHRIWTQQNQVEERLAELNEHIEKVIQMYLRSEYATITEFNAQAGSVSEKYHFLVVADFPAGFSETAARRLQSIAASGPRCGVFTLLHRDLRQALPEGFVAEELRKNSVALRRQRGGWLLERAPQAAGATAVAEEPPLPELAAELIHKIGKSSIDSNRVEVPFSQIAPPVAEMWTGDATGELRVAIGRTGATKSQYLAIGKGTRQHALFAGKTGSGKSTLFHVIVTNLALWYSPEQVEFYLIDFKKGVEFKCYADKRLPHARVVAIESDRQFALSVLQRIDDELKRRGDLFRKSGVQDIPGYKRAGGREAIPRTLLIIDEFQEFFVEDDTVAQSASLFLDRIVRQGRAFGIHVLLGSQTLGGAYTLARATMGQMVIRVALQCNEADAYLIMDENNAAPRLLSRPGEGIYNDAAGAVEGNSPFQVVWLSDEERDGWLDQVQALAARSNAEPALPIVFEGNSPADVRANAALQKLLQQEIAAAPGAARCWLGAPNAIKGPTEALFQRQSGSNLLIVGQRDEAALTMLGLSLLALAAQYPAGAARFVFFQSAARGSRESHLIEQMAERLPQAISLARMEQAAAAMSTLAAELKTRMADGEAGENAAPIFVFVHDLHKFKKLRHEEDFSFSMGGEEEAPANPGAQFQELMTEGAAHGIHLLASVDTFNNVQRFINRKALSEWEMRVIFQMSANDSASLVDAPQATNLGLHRALFYNEREATLETFRPYAAPDADWLRQALEQIARATGVDGAPQAGLAARP